MSFEIRLELADDVSFERAREIAQWCEDHVTETTDQWGVFER